MVEIIINDKDREEKKETIIINPKNEKQAIVIEAPKKIIRPKRKTVEKIIKQDIIVVKNPKSLKAKKIGQKNNSDIIQKITISEMTKILKSNQEFVDEMIKVNTNVMENVLKLSVSVASLTEKMNAFLVKESEEEMPTTFEERRKIEERIKLLEQRINIISSAIS